MNDLEQKASITRSQWSLFFLILAVSAGSVMYRLVVRGRLEQTAAITMDVYAQAITPAKRIAQGKVVAMLRDTKKDEPE